MRPADIQVIGQELAIKWGDATESFISLEVLRRACPCAGCKGEMDIMGNVYRSPAKKLTAASFDLRELRPVGTYAVEPIWGDGHNAGLYTFELLRRLAEQPAPVLARDQEPSHHHEHHEDHDHGHGHCQGRGRHGGHDQGEGQGHGGCGCGHRH
jgi:DUF971 family protein